MAVHMPNLNLIDIMKSVLRYLSSQHDCLRNNYLVTELMEKDFMLVSKQMQLLMARDQSSTKLTDRKVIAPKRNYLETLNNSARNNKPGTDVRRTNVGQQYQASSIENERVHDAKRARLGVETSEMNNHKETLSIPYATDSEKYEVKPSTSQPNNINEIYKNFVGLEDSDEIIEIPTQRLHPIVAHAGYLYANTEPTMEMIAKNMSVWRCNNRLCKGKLSTSGQKVIDVRPHNHAPDQTKVLVKIAMAKFREEAETTNKDHQTIYAEIKSKLPPEAVERLPKLSSIQRNIRRYKERTKTNSSAKSNTQSDMNINSSIEPYSDDQNVDNFSPSCDADQPYTIHYGRQNISEYAMPSFLSRNENHKSSFEIKEEVLSDNEGSSSNASLSNTIFRNTDRDNVNDNASDSGK